MYTYVCTVCAYKLWYILKHLSPREKTLATQHVWANLYRCASSVES